MKKTTIPRATTTQKESRGIHVRTGVKSGTGPDDVAWNSLFSYWASSGY